MKIFVLLLHDCVQCICEAITTSSQILFHHGLDHRLSHLSRHFELFSCSYIVYICVVSLSRRILSMPFCDYHLFFFLWWYQTNQIPWVVASVLLHLIHPDFFPVGKCPRRPPPHRRWRGLLFCHPRYGKRYNQIDGIEIRRFFEPIECKVCVLILFYDLPCMRFNIAMRDLRAAATSWAFISASDILLVWSSREVCGTLCSARTVRRRHASDRRHK